MELRLNKSAGIRFRGGQWTARCIRDTRLLCPWKKVFAEKGWKRREKETL